MKMKKLFALLLTAAMVLSLVACGGGNDTAAGTGDGGEDAAASELTLGYDFATDTEHFGPVYDEWSDLTDDELYAKAQEEGGTITVYATSSKMLKVVEPFLEDYPGLDVDVMDLARERAAYELYDLVKFEGIEVDVLVNNAGMFSFLDILKTPTERISRLLLLHDMTLTLNCRLFGEDMARRGGGHILNMSSFSIWMPFPGLSLYSASKSYVKSFSVAFSKEVQELGIKCTAVCPAGIATDLYGLPADWQRFGVRIGVLMTADRCAKKGLRAMWRGRRKCVPDWWNKIFIPFCLMIPYPLMKLIRRWTARFQK